MSIQIRKATEADVPTIHSFIRRLAIYEKLEHEHVGTEQDLRKTLFQDQFAHVVIAKDTATDKDVGFALYFHNYSTFLSRPGIYLEDLFVSEEARGKGVGKALLQHLAQTVVQMGGGRLEWSALDWNKPAIDFYTSETVGARTQTEWLGFRLAGDALTKFAGL
ncbi:acetyltransferase protein [Chytriomyces cf. hyalinus JEL632]|nr:acetyltransferase protein [Chytriomyces cf. hyalinus JEL632]